VIELGWDGHHERFYGILIEICCEEPVPGTL